MSNPVNVDQVLNASELGVGQSAFRFGFFTVESDRYVCIKDVADDGTKVVTIDMHDNNNVTRKPMKAEAALMNTDDNVMALKAKNETGNGHFIQVFNLDTKEKLNTHHFTENVVFWRWIAKRNLAMVTEKSVYHWDLEQKDSKPTKEFDRGGKLAESACQIVNYSCNKQQTWALLTCISTPDGGKTIEGDMQLFSMERKQQQMLEGHCGVFADMIVDDSGQPKPCLAFSERKKGSDENKLLIMDLSKTTSYKLQSPFKMPPETPMDFPVCMHLSPKHGMLYLVTKGGYGMMFEAVSGARIFCGQVSGQPVFTGVGSARSGGLLVANRKGQLMNFRVNEDAIIPFIVGSMPQLSNRQEVAFSLAKRYGYPGASEMFIQQFERYFHEGDFKNAAKLVAQDKSGKLRCPQTIEKFKSAPPKPGQSTPILQYFSVLLEFGTLTKEESLELSRPVAAQGRKELLEKWIKEDKLTSSEELGDIVKSLDTQLAIQVYGRCQSHQKVVQCLTELGMVDRVLAYVKKVGHQADYSSLLRQMVVANPEGAVKFAKELLENQPPLVDINQVVSVFIAMGKVQETTSVLIDALKANKPEEGPLQTKLFELTLPGSPQAAEAIFQMNLFSHYDRYYVAQLCEKAGLYQRALEHYTEPGDIKRCMLHSQNMSPEFLASYLSNLPGEACLELMYEMMKYNRAQNLQLVVQVAQKNHEAIGASKIVEMFIAFSAWDGVFYFLGSILSTSEDPEVHFKYIEAASRLGHLQEVERVCRETNVYDPEKVKNFLKESNQSDPRSLIYLCDRHGYVEELTEYLYKNGLMKYVEVYVMKVNPQNCPKVVGTLIDLDCSEDFLKGLLQNVRAACPVGPLVEEVERRNRLRLLLSWLEARASEGNQESALHNALAKIYIDTNKNEPEEFLKSNAYYDSAVVGKYCEDRDPHLAFTAYKRAWGACDEQLVKVTNKNGLFRLQARYLVERQDLELWGLVLSEENEYRRQIIDQVVATALPESNNPDAGKKKSMQVSNAVKAFIAAELPNELMELLEKIVLHSSQFSDNRNLQNLLILTAIRADRGRVMDYVNRLDNYDGGEIAKIALGEPYCLVEEAFTIYKKQGMNSEAIDTLLTKIDDSGEECNEALTRAAEFAHSVNEPEVWGKLGRAQLAHGKVCEAMESYLKAEDASDYREVIQVAEREEYFVELVTYLRMARTKVKDSDIDTELVYSLAKCENSSDLEQFLVGTTTANLQIIGSRLYEEGLFRMAKIIFQSNSSHGKLASCHLQLGEYTLAVEAAKKANSPTTWKEVNLACVSAKEFKLAQMAGLYIIVHPDHLEELIQHYERLGHFDQLIDLLEQGLGGERSHPGLYTELGVLYAKYRKEKLMEHCKLHSQGQNRLNVPKLISDVIAIFRACERHQHWAVAVQLHIGYGEFDNAAHLMMLHPSAAWNHEEFISVLKRVSNSEVLYKAVPFYLSIAPQKLNTLLISVAAKVDHARVVTLLRKEGHLGLALPYLKHVQGSNKSMVNEAINELLLELGDYEELRSSIETYDNFEQIGLAQKLEKSERLELRRIAAVLYSQNKRFKQAVELSKKDRLFKDAMERTKESANVELAEALLKFFAFDIEDKECFSACLYTCGELIRPDVAVEIAWRRGYMDQAMPFLISSARELHNKVDRLTKAVEKKEEEKEKSAPNDFVVGMMGGGGLGGHLQLAAEAHLGGQQGQGFGMPPMPTQNAWGM